jgi:hypothetical protein
MTTLKRVVWRSRLQGLDDHPWAARIEKVRAVASTTTLGKPY